MAYFELYERDIDINMFGISTKFFKIKFWN